MAELTEDDVKRIAGSVVNSCRLEIDDEIQRLHEKDLENSWTEEKAKHIAAEAADLAVKQITDNFYMSVGKKTIVTLGALVVGGFLLLQDWVKQWVGLK